MNIERNDIDALNAELLIHIAPSDYSSQVENAIKKYRKTAQIPGFRPGHIPVSLVKQRFGKSLLIEEVNRVLQNNLQQYIQQNGLEILGAPIPAGETEDVGSWDQPGDFKFRYQLGLVPTIDVNLNKDLVFDFVRLDVDDDLVNRQIKDFARRYGKMSNPEISAPEDLLIGTFTQLDETENPKDGGIQNQSTVSIEFIKDEDTRKKLIGLKVDDSLNVNPKLLAESNEDLSKMLNIDVSSARELDSLFQFKVEEVKRIEPHAYDQEFFDKLFGEGEVKSEEEMRQRVKTDLEKRFELDSNYLFKREFAKVITERLNPALPDSFLKKYIAMTNEKPLTTEMIEHDYPLYAAQLRWELIEGKIIMQHGIRVTQEEAMNQMKQSLAVQYAQYGIPVEEEMLADFAKRTLESGDEKKKVYDFLFSEKLIALVKEMCTLNEIKLGIDDFNAKFAHLGNQ